jgi:prepilin-type N-terminal cleavage/methylation domain-containing protein
MKTRGFTLVEVLVAMSLGLILIVGAGEMLTLALAAKRTGDVTAALVHALTDRLESLKALPFDDPALAPGEHEATARIEPGRCLVTESWEVADEGGGAKRVRLRVRLAGGGRGPGMTAIAFILRDLGFEP